MTSIYSLIDEEGGGRETEQVGKAGTRGCLGVGKCEGRGGPSGGQRGRGRSSGERRRLEGSLREALGGLGDPGGFLVSKNLTYGADLSFYF